MHARMSEPSGVTQWAINLLVPQPSSKTLPSCFHAVNVLRRFSAPTYRGHFPYSRVMVKHNTTLAVEHASLCGAGVRPWPLAGDILPLRGFLSSLTDALVAIIWGLWNVQISFVILGSREIGSVFSLNMLMFDWVKLHLHTSGFLRMSPPQSGSLAFHSKCLGENHPRSPGSSGLRSIR